MTYRRIFPKNELPPLPIDKDLAVWVHRRGQGSSGIVEMRAVTSLPPDQVTNSEIQSWQRLAGYPPEGYGQLSWSYLGEVGDPDGLYVYSFGCFASCD